MLTIKNLKVMYKDFVALDIDQTITFNTNDRIGIIGANGSGKSTFIKALLGLVKANMVIDTKLSLEDMAVHMQSNEYVDTVSVDTIFKALLTKEEYKSAQFNELLDFFDYKNQLKKKFKQLSGGQKQRLTIILVLMQNKSINFFDEVTTGLGFETRTNLMEKILKWFEHKNATIVLVTHYYEELDRLADKILILDHGKLIDFDYKEKLFEKYCGYSVIMYEEDKLLTFEHLDSVIAPKPYKALKCKNKEDELKIITILNKNGVNFKRTNHDIELIYLNAIGGNK